MKRRNFLKLFGISAAAPVVDKILAKPAKLQREVEGAVSEVIHQTLDIPRGGIITDINQSGTVIRLSEVMSFNVCTDNNIMSMPTIGDAYRNTHAVPGRFEVSMSADFLAGRDLFGLMQSGAPVTIINDVPRFEGILPLTSKAIPGRMDISAGINQSVVIRADFTIISG